MSSHHETVSPPFARAIEARPARRLRRAADRRAYERICRRICAAAGLADRLSGLGRHRGGAARGGGDLHRRPLYASGARAGRRRSLALCRRCPTTQRRRLAWPSMPARAARIGYDPWLHTRALGRRRRARRWPSVGAELVAVDTNPVDAVWPDRPAPSDAKLVVQPTMRARADPRPRSAQAIADWLTEQKGRCGGALRARFDRLGAQRPRRRRRAHARSRSAYAIVDADGTADLFVAPEKIDRCGAPASRQRGARPRSRSTSRPRSAGLPASASPPIPSARSPRSSTRSKRAARRCWRCAIPSCSPRRSRTTPRSPATRRRSVRDGAALSRFLRWVEQTAPKGGIDRARLRRQAAAISARRPACSRTPRSTRSRRPARTAPARITIRRPKSNRRSKPGQLYLVDSGGQYDDGTTDVTRVIPIGDADPRDARPLHPRAQGPYRARHRAVPARAPTAASSMASRAGRYGRRGSISRMAPATASAPICRSMKARSGSPSPPIPAAGRRSRCAPGMILSNEPGYYKAGEYGIRIENLVLVVEREVRRRRHADARLRDADLRADRAQR